MKIPPELLDRFVDELGQNLHLDSENTKVYRTALRACLFVSRDFRSRAIRHLFHSVSVGDAVVSEEIEGGVTLLESSVALLHDILDMPHGLHLEAVGPIIKEFVISFGWIVPQMRTAYSSYVRDFLASDNLLALMDFILTPEYGPSSFIFHLPSVSWTSLSPNFQAKFLSLAQSPFLRALTLNEAKDLSINLFDGSHITKLHLINADIEDKDRAQSSAGVPALRLEHFECSGSTVDLLDFNHQDSLHPALFGNLARLKLSNIAFRHQTTLCRVLELASHTLAHVELGCHSQFLIHLDDLGHMLSLQYLFLRVESGPHCMANLSRFFAARTPVQYLNTIRIIFSLQIGAFQVMENQPARGRSYSSAIDRHLTGECYPSLKNFSLQMDPRDPLLRRGYSSTARVRNTAGAAHIELHEMFPRASSSSTLKFTPLLTPLDF